ncbi:hypothetical protein P9112_008980 [Eukaryota sp. TZLM1-RC]
MAPPCAFYLNQLPTDNITYYTKTISECLAHNADQFIVSTYQADPEWLFDQLPVLLTRPCHFFVGDNNLLSLNKLKLPNLIVSKPRLPLPFGTYHSKFFISICANRIVIAITTSNLAKRDWESRNQGIYYQEFPLRSADGVVKDSRFKDPLIDYLTFCGYQTPEILDKYDYSQAKVFIVPSLPGTWRGEVSNQYGQKRIRSIIDSAKSTTNQATFVFSSFGKLSSPFLRSITSSLRVNQVGFVWPTVDDVRTSVLGYESGFSLCCNHRNLTTDVRSNLRRWEPVKVRSCFEDQQLLNKDLMERANVMPHCKFFARGTPDSLSTVFLGSHNMSTAAFGTISASGSLTVRSYELGVLWQRGLGIEELSCFETDDGPKGCFLPLPFKFPARRYGANDTPWSWDISHMEPDIYGRSFTV